MKNHFKDLPPVDADPENGIEDIECTRCGYSEHFQF